jgi:hypothetical protein
VIILFSYLLQSFVLHFPFLASEWILKSGIISGIHDQLTKFAELAFPWYSKQWSVKEGVVLSQVLFPLIPEGQEVSFLTALF